MLSLQNVWVLAAVALMTSTSAFASGDSSINCKFGKTTISFEPDYADAAKGSVIDENVTFTFVTQARNIAWSPQVGRQEKLNLAAWVAQGKAFRNDPQNKGKVFATPRPTLTSRFVYSSADWAPNAGNKHNSIKWNEAVLELGAYDDSGNSIELNTVSVPLTDKTQSETVFNGTIKVHVDKIPGKDWQKKDFLFRQNSTGKVTCTYSPG